MLRSFARRRPWSRTAIVSLLVTAGALALESGARADERTEARRFYERGMQLIVKGQYEQGIAELQRAYDTLPHPNVLYNIGRAYVEMGEYEKALGYFRRYLQTEPADRGEVQEVVDRLQSLLDRQRADLAAAQRPRTPAQPAAASAPSASQAPQPTGTTPAPSAAPDTTALDTKTDAIYEETVVTASRGAQTPLDAPNSTSIITEQDIRLSGITKIPELLRRVAGVDLMEITGGDTNVAIRGFNERLSNKLLVLVDGRSVYIDLLGATLWEALTIDVDQIERIEVVRGPGSALYGADAFSGVVNIITKPPGEGRSGVRVGYGDHMQAYGSLRVSGRSGDLAYRVSSGYTRYPRWSRTVASDRIDVHVIEDDQFTAAENLRFDARTTQRLGTNTALHLGGGFSEANLELTGIGVFYDYVAKLRTADVTAALTTKNFRARTFYNRFDALNSGMNANYIGQQLYRASAYTNVLDTELEFFDLRQFGGSTNELHVGANYRLKNVDWPMVGGEHTENHGALFLEDSFAPAKWIKFVLSGRLDYNPYLEQLLASPRASIVLHPSERSTIRLSGATAYKKPSFLEAYSSFPLQLPVTGADAFYGNDLFVAGSKLAPERISAVELGYQNQENEYFEWEVAAYLQHVSDFINGAPFPVATPSDVAQGNAGFNQTTGRYTIAYGGLVNECATRDLYGGEAGVPVYPVVGLDLFANYAWTRFHDNIPQGCFAKPFGHQSEHKVNAGVQVRTALGIDGEVAFHYVSDQTWTEMVASLGSTADVKYESFPLDGYTLVNARLGYRFYKNRAEVSATAFNLLDNVHREHPIGQLVGRRFMGFMAYRF